MLTDTGITLYRFNGAGFERCYIGACHWQESKAANVLKSGGNQNADGITVYVPADSLRLTPNKLLLPGGSLFPNADISPQNAAKDIIVKGECNFLFDNSSERTVSESLRELRNNYDIHTVMSVDRLLYGSPDLRHIKISAR